MEGKCFEEESRLLCKTSVNYTNSKCGHLLKRKCHVDENTLTCGKPCDFMYQCGHKCTKTCGANHDHKCCDVEEKTVFPLCQHDLPKKVCGKPISDYKCEAKVIGESYERFGRKRTLAKYQSQSEMIKVML